MLIKSDWCIIIVIYRLSNCIFCIRGDCVDYKKTFAVFSCLIIFAVSFVLIMSSVVNINVNVSNNTIKKLPDIVIDPGHGGEDGGAVNDSGVLEKNINLSISNDTADLFSFLGFDVTKTRSEDCSLSDDGDTVHKRKVADMKKRLEKYNSSDNNVVISIHQNKFTESQYHGTQIFYSKNNEKSKLLAENIKYSVKAQLQPDNERECKAADKSIYLLHNAKVPSVIVECGFISNKEECQNLLCEDYQKQMSYAIVTGFLDYYNTN